MPAARWRSCVVLVGALLLAGCTDDPAPTAFEQDPTTAGASSTVAAAGATPTLPPVIANWDGIEDDDQLVVQSGTGPTVLALPDVSGYRSLIATIECPDDDTPYQVQYLTSGKAADGFSSGGCGGTGAETAALDRADLPTMVQVTVPTGAGFTVWIYGVPRR